MADTLTLEQLAHNVGYEKQDICGCVPVGGLCYAGKYHKLRLKKAYLFFFSGGRLKLFSKNFHSVLE